MYSPNLLFFIPNLPRTSLDDDSVILFSGNIEFPSYDGFFWLGRFWLQITILTVKQFTKLIQGVPANSTISLSTIPGIVRFKIVLNSTNVFCLFFSKNGLSISTFYVLSTSPRLVRFLNSTIPWEPKICTIRGPPVFDNLNEAANL